MRSVETKNLELFETESPPEELIGKVQRAIEEKVSQIEGALSEKHLQGLLKIEIERVLEPVGFTISTAGFECLHKIEGLDDVRGKAAEIAQVVAGTAVSKRQAA